MATRVTEEDVLAILPADTGLDYGDIDPYIVSANALVTDLLADEHTDAVLTEIEKWLSAHMASVVRERLIKKAGAGGAMVEYAGWWTDGLGSIQYGQMVLMLDTSNILRNLKEGKKQAWTYVIPEE